MKLITENRIVYFLMAVLIITTVVDLVTALRMPLFESGETNPLYNIGGLKLLLGFTVFYLVFIGWKVRGNVSFPSIFYIVTVLIYLSAGHLMGAGFNLTATQQYNDDPVIFTEAIEKMDSEDKSSFYFGVVGLFIMIPMIITFMCFFVTWKIYLLRKPKRELLYRKAHELIKKAEE